MQRRSFLSHSAQALALALFWPIKSIGKIAPKFSASFAAKLKAEEITSFAFGSCLIQDEPQPIWPAIARQRPDFFIFLGDNIYSDSYDVKHMFAQYEKLAAKPEFANFREQFPIIATWDDHDYGVNDCGQEFTQKEMSRKLMLNFFEEPANSLRRSQSGIYTSYYFGKAPYRTQVILLDLRWNRTPLSIVNDRYVPNTDPNSTMLGEEQWTWLEAELKEPADLRILGSSIQLVSSEHRWEKWSNFPLDKSRLFEVIDRENIKNLVVISGDMHFGEISRECTSAGIPIYDLTSSGLNRFETAAEFENSKRLIHFDQGANFGLVNINWQARSVTLQVADVNGAIQLSHSVNFF